MRHILGCDVHKRYSIFVAINGRGKQSKPVRVEHERAAFRAFLESLPPHSDIAVEATGHWYWIIDEMEQAEHRPHLANPHESKKRMGKPNKHDALDAGGLGILLHNGTLPEAWIPPGELRDQRELLRTRMALRDLRTALKHRIHAAIDRYGLHNDALSDLFGKAGREFLLRQITGLPPETRSMLFLQLEVMDDLEPRIADIEARIAARIQPSPEVQLLMTIPGVGKILGPLLWLEIGNVERFPRAENLASYAGLVPRVFSSGGHITHGHTSRYVNHYLRWGFIEAATCAVRHHSFHDSHVGVLFQRLLPTRGYGRAIVAVARHLAEASYWMLRKRQAYRPPQPKLSEEKLLSSRIG
jgi:transposase